MRGISPSDLQLETVCLSETEAPGVKNITHATDPTQQSEFDDQVVNNVTEIEPGHQCYKLNQLEGITPGTNATIQLEYWSEFEGENNGNNQSFFACADVVC